MNELLALMTPEEIDDGLWFVDVCERNGNMDQAEADEGRRRILARQRFLDLPDTYPPTAQQSGPSRSRFQHLLLSC